jgi:putative spermidine/putrescine transport system ATP-binding protein
MRIGFEALRVERSGHRALAGVSGEIASGTITAVIGPSGAGKSSLLGVIAGLLPPDGGAVRFDAEDVTAWPAERRRLGVVFQELRLFDFMSGRDNVGFAPRVEGLAADEQRRRVDEALALVRAEKFAHRPARVLSGGERQRIALARALAMRPRALLLDEPFAALDAELRRNLRDELRQLVQRLGLTVLLVTHDRDDAFSLAGRFIVLRDGRVEQSGDAAELYQRPASEFVATLLGEANVLPVEARDGDRARVLGEWIAVAGDGDRALLRPEQLELAADGAGWRAQLVDARFAGSRWRLTLELPDGRRLIALAEHAPAGGSLVLRPRGAAHLVRARAND